MSGPRYVSLAGLLALLLCAPENGALAQTEETPSIDSAPGLATPGFCDGEPQLRLLRGLDFGDVRLASGAAGYITVMPDGVVLHSGDVLVVREPLPGEMEICSAPDLDIAILVESPELELLEGGAQRAARSAGRFLVDSHDIALDRAEPGRWEGRLGPSGRAIIRIGATLDIDSNHTHGNAAGAISIDVVPR
jgi:hypothetical protein